VAAISGPTPYATYGLIAANVIVFLAELASGSSAGLGFTAGGDVYRHGALYGPAVANGDWYRLITSGFLHAGLLHIGFNMFVLFVLGRVLEPAIGSLRLLAIYFVSLLAGSFGALLLDPTTPTVGASGAIFGLMAATFVIARRRGVDQVASQIGIWIVLNIALSFSISGISIGGHLGGLVGGALAALAVSHGERQPGRSGLPIEIGGMSVIAAVAVAGALSVAANI
jgi:membrane associated rhomboid family serine protease